MNVDQKGTQVSHTARSARTPFLRTGFFATLSNLLGRNGSGAGSSGRGSTALPRLAALTLIAAAAFLAVSASSAAARETHLLAPPPIGEAGSGPGQLDLAAPAGIGVNDTTGDVYVADAGNGRVDQFEADGTFVRSFGSFTAPAFLAVDNSSGEEALYVADTATNTVLKFNPDGTAVTAWGSGGQLSEGGGNSFGEIAGIAVGPAGNLFVTRVAGGGGEPTFKFEPNGTFIESIATEFGTAPAGIAVDSVGDIYKVRGNGAVAKLNPAGAEINSGVDPGPATGLAVEPGTDGLYVAREGDVAAYDSSGGQLDVFGAGDLAKATGVAVGPASTVYVTDSAAQHILRFTPGVLPDVATGSATAVGPAAATLNGTVNPAGVAVTECRFSYVDASHYDPSAADPYAAGETAPCAEAPAAIGTGNSPVPVHADLIELRGGTEYHFRLSASSSFGPNLGADATFTTLGPSVLSESASDVSATAATLEATLNPNGAATAYEFQYVTDALFQQFGYAAATGVPAGGALIGSGFSPVPVSAQIQGLQPQTTYHYRVLAENALGTSEGPDLTFTTQGTTLASALLPDGRQWELVSPPNKHGSLIVAIGEGVGQGTAIQAAVDGSAITYAAAAPVTTGPAGNRTLNRSQVLSRRSAAGWGSEEITTAHEEVVGVTPGDFSEYKFFSPDLSAGFVEPLGATPLSPQAGERTPYRRQPNGEYTPLLTEANVPKDVHFGGTKEYSGGFFSSSHFVTATPDGAHAVISSPQPLTEDFAPTFVPDKHVSSSFEWSEGTLSLISQVPAGTESRCGGSAPACVPAAELGQSSTLGYSDLLVRDALSEGGDRAVFGVTSPSVGRQLFLRDIARGETVRLDAVQGGSGFSHEPHFVAASADDSKIFFTDEGKLTADSTAELNDPDLYMCEIEVGPGGLACALSDLTVDANPGEHANVLGVPGVDRSGRYVYFVANGRLAPDAVSGTCDPPPAATRSCNLYLRDTVAESTKLVAVLAGSDYPSWEPASNNDLGTVTSRVSPSGRYLAFMSSRPLTGFDNRDAASGRPDQEVFLYDAQGESGAGKLICASCAPTGARPRGIESTSVFPGLLVDRPFLWTGQTLAASIPGWTRIDVNHALYQSRYLSDSGRLFFNAATPLVPQDSNGAEDVYQYEPAGVGSCTADASTYSPKSAGCVDLISSGTSGEESAFLDASESGDDVFFLTASRLAPQDTDSAFDVYDAHVCSTASPCPPPPAPPAPVCAGDACQQPAVPPNDPTPGSLTFNGAGNLLQCPKGKVKQKGKCVKHKSKKHKKSHKKHAQKRTASHGRGGSK